MSTTMEGVKEVTRQVSKTLTRRAPTILTVMGVAGTIATAVLASKATIKARELFEDKYESLHNVDPYWKDYIKLTWKEYIPTVLMGAATITCIIGSNSIHWQRTAALQGIYSLTDMAFKEYQGKVVEILGNKKEEKVREEIIQDRLDANPVSNNIVYMTGHGENLCYDSLSGRYFKSDIEKLRRIENHLNHILISEMWVSLNELYSEMGLGGIALGEDLGWSVDELIEFIFTTKLSDTDEPCLVISHRVAPVPASSLRG